MPSDKGKDLRNLPNVPEISKDVPAPQVKDTRLGNPSGNVVDNSEGDRSVSGRSQGTSSNQGAYISMQSRPSWLY